MVPFDYKDCINSDESNTNNKSEAIMSSKPNYRHMIRSSAGKGFGKKGWKSKTALNCQKVPQIWSVKSLLIIRTASIQMKVTQIVNQRQLWAQNQIIGIWYEVVRARVLEKRVENQKLH